jgi:hypothetical protein
VDLCGTTTGIKDVFRDVFRDVLRLPGRATGLPHKLEPDSVVATIAETGQETADSAEGAANDSIKRSPE